MKSKKVSQFMCSTLHLGLTSNFLYHVPSCPHGMTSNKAFTLVWNRGLKGQSSLMILFLSLAASKMSKMIPSWHVRWEGVASAKREAQAGAGPMGPNSHHHSHHRRPGHIAKTS